MPMSKNKETPSKAKTKAPQKPKTPSKPSSKNSSSKNSEVPELPEFVKDYLKTKDKNRRGERKKIAWVHDVAQEEKELKEYEEFLKTGIRPKRKRQKPKCYRVGKNHVMFRYSSSSFVQHISDFRTKTQRLVMMEAGIVPPGGFTDFDGVTEDVSEPDDDYLSQKPADTQKTLIKLKDPNENKKEMKIQNQKTSKSEDWKKVKEERFKKSYYVLNEVNEKSSYFAEKPKESEGVKKSHVVFGIPDELKKKVPEDVKAPEAHDLEILKISKDVKKSHEEMMSEVPEDVKTQGTPEPKTLKNPEDVKASEYLQNKKNPEFIQSNYIAKGLNEDSGYCIQKDSGFSKDGDVQKTLKDSKGSGTQKPGNS